MPLFIQVDSRMKPSFSKIAGASIIALSVAVAPLSLPANAQTTTTPNTTTTTTVQETRDDNNSWGWLGLLGLIGLAGLFRQPKRTVAYRDPAESGTTTTNRY
nr:WGxxGxxG family protein [Chroococcidiopsis sp. TS-821]